VPLQPLAELEAPLAAVELLSPPPVLLLLFEQPLRTIAPAAPKAKMAVIAFLCTYLPPFKKRTNGLAVLPTWRNIS
jgi:hypothetical protein